MGQTWIHYQPQLLLTGIHPLRLCHVGAPLEALIKWEQFPQRLHFLQSPSYCEILSTQLRLYKPYWLSKRVIWIIPWCVKLLWPVAILGPFGFGKGFAQISWMLTTKPTTCSSVDPDLWIAQTLMIWLQTMNSYRVTKGFEEAIVRVSIYK